MDLTIVEEGPEKLEEYGVVPISFTVNTVLDVVLVNKNGLGGIKLVEQKVEKPYVKDYDFDGGPGRWRQHWDLSNWGIFSAFTGQERIGGAVVAFNTNGVNFLEGRDDVAALWDIRVLHRLRGCGIGTKLFQYALAWATERKCAQLKVETQNINVAACRFYVKQGCHLGTINRYAYTEFPEETELIWYKDLR